MERRPIRTRLLRFPACMCRSRAGRLRCRRNRGRRATPTLSRITAGRPGNPCGANNELHRRTFLPISFSNIIAAHAGDGPAAGRLAATGLGRGGAAALSSASTSRFPQWEKLISRGAINYHLGGMARRSDCRRAGVWWERRRVIFCSADIHASNAHEVSRRPERHRIQEKTNRRTALTRDLQGRG